MLSFLFFVFLNIKKQGSSEFLALLLTTGVFYIAKGFAGERPQLFTFFIFSLVYYLLVEDPTHREDFRINRSKRIFLIPPLVMLLANMHPGYIVCILLISIYLIGEGYRYFIKKDPENRFKDTLKIWILTILFSAFNPNGIDELKNIFSIGKHAEGIVEFMPTFSLYARKMEPISYPYIIFLFLSIIGLRYIKKISLTHILLLIVFSAMSFMSIRYLIFYMCVSVPIIAKIIINLITEKTFERLFRTLRTRERFLYLVSCIIGIFLIFNSIPALAKYEFKADTSFAIPQGAADFLSNLKINGNMFNEYGFGGYLIWRLYPDKKVFIDGRALEPDIMDEYNMVGSAVEMPYKSWEDIVKKYNISYIVMPPLLPRGEVYLIVERLLERDEWVLIYSDHLSLIFLRKDSKNETVIKEYGKDKREGFNTIIIQASARAMKNLVNPYYPISLGKVFFKMGKIDDAEKAFLMAYERDPKNSVIKEWLQKVRSNKK